MSQNIDYERLLYCIKWTQASYRNTTRRLTQTPACLTDAYWGMTQASVQLNAPQSKLQLWSRSTYVSTVSRQIVNVGLLDGWRLKEDDWRRTREMRGEGMRMSGSAEWKWLVINRPQQCWRRISSPLSVPDASWLLLLLERPGGWFITSRKQRELLDS